MFSNSKSGKSYEWPTGLGSNTRGFAKFVPTFFNKIKVSVVGILLFPYVSVYSFSLLTAQWINAQIETTTVTANYSVSIITGTWLLCD